MGEFEFIERTLREAGELAKGRYLDRTQLRVSHKSDLNDLLTETDLAVQHRVVERIAKAFPGDLVLAEEAGFHTRPEGRTGRCWVLDPIDGTANFVRGLFPVWGVSLAFAERDEVLAGGVYFPVANDLFLAERGAGAHRNGTRLAVSVVGSLDTARLDLDVSSASYRTLTLEHAPEVYRRAGQLRVHGCAVAALCSVATGDMDAYLHAALNPWDFAAGMLIIEEAGGRVTQWDGRPLTLFDGRRSVLANNGALHGAFLEHIRLPKRLG